MSLLRCIALSSEDVPVCPPVGDIPTVWIHRSHCCEPSEHDFPVWVRNMSQASIPRDAVTG